MMLRSYFLLSFFATLAVAQTEALDLVVALDVSQGMAEPGKFIREGVRLAAYELTADDKVAVLSFGSGVKLYSGFTENAVEIDRAVRKATQPIVRRGERLRLYDGVFSAIEQFSPTAASNRRRAIAVITNDADRGSVHQSEEVIRQAHAKAISIFVFLIANPYSTPDRQRTGYPSIPYPDVRFAATQLRQLANETGGTISVLDMNGYILRRAIAACKGAAE